MLGPRAARCCPRAGPGSPTFELAGTGARPLWARAAVFKITGSSPLSTTAEEHGRVCVCVRARMYIRVCVCT